MEAGKQASPRRTDHDLLQQKTPATLIRSIGYCNPAEEIPRLTRERWLLLNKRCTSNTCRTRRKRKKNNKQQEEMKTTDSIPKKLTKKYPLECRKKHAPGERDEGRGSASNPRKIGQTEPEENE
jgi:hypothetical protein